MAADNAVDEASDEEFSGGEPAPAPAAAAAAADSEEEFSDEDAPTSDAPTPWSTTSVDHDHPQVVTVAPKKEKEKRKGKRPPGRPPPRPPAAAPPPQVSENIHRNPMPLTSLGAKCVNGPIVTRSHVPRHRARGAPCRAGYLDYPTDGRTAGRPPSRFGTPRNCSLGDLARLRTAEPAA